MRFPVDPIVKSSGVVVNITFLDVVSFPKGVFIGTALSLIHI